MSQRGTQSPADELREQGRAIVGALLVVGTTFLYTMETWWWGRVLPTPHLLVYAVVGLGVILAITRRVSFRRDAQGDGGTKNAIRTTVTDFAELVLQSFTATYIVLFVFGVIELGDSLIVIARLGLIEVVPLGFGAALANEVLQGDKQATRRSVTTTVAIYSVGAVFIAGGISPTQEMELIAAYMEWEHTAVLVLLSLLVSYLMLYELGFQGEGSRLQQRAKVWQVGQAFVVYAVSMVVGTGLLAAFGHFRDAPPSVMVQLIVIISFVSSIGASAAEVVIQ
ncbi:DUF2391 family protein [Halorussus sp. MSC15.2]|uniref:DUF2391 family protein n=1 Tax=Halorussus sp. MSC15.2 TaxID=2283638 RepID=UPI0013D171A0|nr:DUF2391 family protein [Halorussus sp. MSC15.2]NEU55295.1 DUF2391 family protein [Halorussus sp. MSC15.2]